MLEIKDLYVSYGMMEVLHGISVNVEDDELVSIIGPNGAGKTTLIKTVMGLVKPTSGSRTRTWKRRRPPPTTWSRCSPSCRRS